MIEKRHYKVCTVCMLIEPFEIPDRTKIITPLYMQLHCCDCEKITEQVVFLGELQ